MQGAKSKDQSVSRLWIKHAATSMCARRCAIDRASELLCFRSRGREHRARDVHALYDADGFVKVEELASIYHATGLKGIWFLHRNFDRCFAVAPHHKLAIGINRMADLGSVDRSCISCSTCPSLEVGNFSVNTDQYRREEGRTR